MIMYVIIGFLSGIISGMGIGGGSVMIPALTIVLGMSQKSAQNINLIYFIPTAAIALFTHKREGNIESRSLIRIIIFGLIGAAAGSLIAVNIDPDLLKRLFGGFLFVVGVYEIFFNKCGK